MSGRWKRILALGAAVVLCLIAAAQMGSLFHWKVTCTPAAFAESSRRLSNPDRGFYYICRMISRQGESGADWMYSLLPVYGIYLLNFSLPEFQSWRTDVVLQ